jgi:hypothetical protein
MTVGDGGGCAGPGKGDTGRGGGREGAVGGQRFGDGTVKRDAACVLKRIEKKQVIRLSLGSTQSAFVKRGIPSWGPTYAQKKASLRASQSISFQKISSSILAVGHGVCRGSKPKRHRRQADEEARSLL